MSQGWPCDFRLLGTQQALVSIILHAESHSSKFNGVLNRINHRYFNFVLLCCTWLLNLRNHSLPSLIGIQDRVCIAHSVSKHIFQNGCPFSATTTGVISEINRARAASRSDPGLHGSVKTSRSYSSISIVRYSRSLDRPPEGHSSSLGRMAAGGGQAS